MAGDSGATDPDAGVHAGSSAGRMRFLGVNDSMDSVGGYL